MANYPSTSRGYLSSSRNANPPGAYYEVMQTDFGQLGGAAPSLAYNAGAGSLASGTARCAISWITAQGESQVSTEATVSISANSGAFTITQPTVPTNGAPVIGWRVYSSSGGAGTPLLNTASSSTTQAQSNIVTTQGTLLCFPIATTSVQVLIYGTGQGEPTYDQSGIQSPLPSVAANTSVDYYFRVPNSGSLWRTQKDPAYARPLGIPDPAGISMGNVDILMPLYPGTSASVSAGTYMVMNGYLYLCTVAGTTASTFIGGSAFNQTKGATTTDGTVTWTSYGKTALVRARISNSSGSGAIPAAQEYDFFAS
jgi:hypothetical protein